MANTPIRTFRCEDEYWDALGRIAKEQERTQSWLTRKAVQEFIERDRAAKRAAKQAADQEKPSK
ncbi:MAG TPA: ribbon-helix-helix protein, CopG family [Candidatus Acidoferrum sp.]